jgi:hypothetical protein
VIGTKPLCPDCGGEVYYIQTVIEYWSWKILDEWIELEDHIDSVVDEEGAEIQCEDCQRTFSIEEATKLMAVTKENKYEQPK